MKVIYSDGVVRECEADEQLHIMRHTAAHIMAQAVNTMWTWVIPN